MKKKWKLLNDDCVKLMKKMKANSIDSIICDPPYGLEFMGRDWDKIGDVRQPGDKNYTKTKASPYDRSKVRYGGTAGYRSAGTGMRQQEWHYQWAVEALRVAKPGAHLLAFGGTRTHHRLMCALEDAGWEIRDCLMWLYGSGFPKSLDVSKAMDKEAKAKRKVVGKYQPPGMKKPWNLKNAKDKRIVPFSMSTRNNLDVTKPNTDSAKQWQGWGTSVKPAWEPIILARKPMTQTVAKNVVEYGTGALNIDATRISVNPDTIDDSRLGGRGKWKTEGMAKNVYAGGYAGLDNPSFPLGRFPANLVLSHTPNCKVVGTKQVESGNVVGRNRDLTKSTSLVYGGRKNDGKDAGYGTEIVDAWECDAECPVRLLNEQSGELTSGKLLSHHRRGGRGLAGTSTFAIRDRTDEPCNFGGDSGGASRFFYCAKVSRQEREAGCEQLAQKKMYADGARSLEILSQDGRPQETLSVSNNHPTVKPISLMRWLITLVTPPNGVILDPFTGSGSTGCAAATLGFDFVGIEKEKAYITIAKARIKYWSSVKYDEEDGNHVVVSTKASEFFE